VKIGEFPRPVFLSDAGRTPAWLESEIIAWQLLRITKREAEKPGEIVNPKVAHRRRLKERA
jgi:hypothetical protein